MSAIKLTPNIAVVDVVKTALYYMEFLGFDLVLGVTPEKQDIMEISNDNTKLLFAILKKDQIEIMFQDNNSLVDEVPGFCVNESGDALALYIELDDVDKFYNTIGNKVELIKDINTTFYKMKEFVIRDCNGLIITFAQREQ